MKCLIYCTKGKPYLFNRIINGKSDGFYTDIVPYDIEDTILNGSIVAEFDCDKVEHYVKSIHNGKCCDYRELLNKSCISGSELIEYCNGLTFYALHINNLKVFKKPKKLVGMYSTDKYYYKPIMKAPQNMCNAYDRYADHYVIISIRPEWVCKILNGEKKIEVRKQIVNKLKEVIV